MKRRALYAALLVIVVGTGAALALATPALPDRRSGVPTARVAKGPLALTVHAVGEVRAGRTVALSAPSVGGSLRIVRLLPTGTHVSKGDVLVEFDPADQRYALEQARSEVAEAEQQIVKMKADAAVAAAQDQVSLLTARFAVRRAELDASGNEFFGAIQAQKNLLTLEEAKRGLAQLDEDAKSRAATNQASLVVVQERRNKAMLAMQRAQQNIDSLVVTAPLDGVVFVKENRSATQVFFMGMTLPEYREGDTVGSGGLIVDVIETGRMDVRAKVDENDRGNLAVGQAAVIRIDSLPGETFPARIAMIAGLASRGSMFEATISRQFDVTFTLDKPDPRLKAGSSVQVTIEGKEIPDALTVPRQAIFQKSGKTSVFVKAGDGFEQRDVTVVQRTESRAAITGVSEGTEIALVDPNAAGPNTAGAATAPVPGGAR